MLATAKLPFRLAYLKPPLAFLLVAIIHFIGEESCQLLHASGWRKAPANEQYTFEKATRAGFTERGKEKAVFLLPQFGHTLTTVKDTQQETHGNIG